jgi:hypothetical protein
LALLLSIVLIAGLIYFVHALWPLLPSWLAMIVFIIIAAAFIGAPIYSLARWSNQPWPKADAQSTAAANKHKP